MRVSLLLAALLELSGCDKGTTSPQPSTTTTTSILPPNPRVDAPFSWERYQGFSAFGLFAHDEEVVKQTIANAASHGFNTPRVCAETEWWDGDYYYPRVLRDTIQLRIWLDFLARISGVQILLIADCTYKHNASDADQVKWISAVADVASDYKNVALEVVNEYDHPTYNMGRAAVIEAIRYSKGRVAEVGSDSGTCWFTEDLRHPLQRYVTFASFHPCRTKGSGPWDPPREFLERLVSENGGLAVLSETVAFDDSGLQCEDGLRTCDRDRVQSYINRCASVTGCKFTFHSLAGLRGADYTWFPQAR